MKPMDIKGKSVLITGATGFIGGQLTRRLATTDGVQVRALARNLDKARPLADLGVKIIPGDLTQPETLKVALHGCQVVFHAAAWVSETGGRDQMWAVNVTGTQHLVDAAVAAGTVERFVHLSSCAVYGSRQAFDIDERTPVCLTGSPYADSKIAAEALVFRAYRSRNLPVVAARASQVYGPGSYQFTVRPVELIKAGKMVLVDGGRHLCKPVYIDNLIDGLISCATVDAAIGEAINFTDGQPIPWRDFFGAYGRMAGIEKFLSAPFPVAWLAALANETGSWLSGKPTSLNRRTIRALRSSNSFSHQKARALLGWQPLIDFEEGMRRTEAWLRAEGYITTEE